MLPTFSTHGMNFAFAPLGKSSQVEVGLSTAFAGGEIRGAFPRVGGQIEFKPEYLANTKGKVQLDARALQFGNYKVAAIDLRESLPSRHAPQVLIPASNPNRPQVGTWYHDMGQLSS